jgi:hypothetical protein
MLTHMHMLPVLPCAPQVRQKCPSILLQLQKAFPNKFPLSSNATLTGGSSSSGDGSNYYRPSSPPPGALGMTGSPSRSPPGLKTPAKSPGTQRSWLV